MTEPPLIIDPRDGKVYNFNRDEHDFRHMPPAMFRLFWWLASSRHEDVNWNDEKAVGQLIDQLSVQPGKSPKGRIGQELFDAYAVCGGPSRDFPYRVRTVEVDHYKDQLKHL